MGHRGKGSAAAFGLKRGKGLFPAPGQVLRVLRRREVVLRSDGRVRYLSLSGPVQLVLVAALAAAGGWTVYSSFSYIRSLAVVAGKDREIATLVTENRGLAATMARMQDEFSDVAGTLERNHRDLRSLARQNEALGREIEALRTALGRAELHRQAGDKLRAALRQQIEGLESRLASAERRSRTLAATLAAARAQLAAVRKDRDGIAAERDGLSERIVALESRLASLQDAQSDLIDRLTGKTAADIERIERLIADTGLDPDERIGRMAKAEKEGAGDGASGLGGPFIPFPEGLEEKAVDGGTALLAGLREYDRRMSRHEDLRRLLRSLPLAAPLAGRFWLSSGFGKRYDPINGRLAMHEGVDLGSARRAPVHATAAGTVVFAGWKGKFGRLVEIDHGFGIRTRYAHLRRIQVKRGQKVSLGQAIGEVGSSGRSTGTHLHYEVRVDDKPVDPRRFMRAGKDVFKG